MNIDLIYQGNSYNFDLRKDINIKYIYDLASKLINKDISTFELFYKKENLSDYEYSTLLKDLVKDSVNISILISPKENNNLLSSEKIYKKIKELKSSKNSDNKYKVMLTSPRNISQNNSRKSSNAKINLFQNKKTKITKEYIFENKVFEDIYNSKENEIISLMNDLSQKIKEYDDILYKNSNNELSLYEKIIIDFKNKQITFFKKLLNFFNNSEKDFISGELSLKDFFIDLKQYYNLSTINVNNNIFNKKNVNNNNDYNKNNNKNNFNDKKIIKLTENSFIDKPKIKLATNNSNDKSKIKFNDSNFNDKPKIKLLENNLSFSTTDENKLPLIIDNKVRKSVNLTETDKVIYSDVVNENNSEFGNEQQLLKAKLLKKENQNIKSKNENKNYKEYHNKSDINDKIITNKNDNNIIINSNIDSNNKKYVLNEAVNISKNNVNNSIISNNTSDQEKNAKKFIVKNNEKESKKNGLLNKSKSNKGEKIHKSIKFKDQKRLSILFEEPNNKQSNYKDDSSNLSENSSQRRSSRDSNKKLTKIEENIMAYKRKLTRKQTLKLKKKFGKNANDFIF